MRWTWSKMRKRWARQTKGRQMVKMRRIYNSFYSGRSQLQPRLLPSDPLHAATCHQKCLFVIHYFNILLYSRSWYVFFFFYLTFDCEHSTHGLLRTFYMFSLCFSNLSLYITSPAPLPMQTACWANRWQCTALLRASLFDRQFYQVTEPRHIWVCTVCWTKKRRDFFVVSMDKSKPNG